MNALEPTAPTEGMNGTVGVPSTRRYAPARETPAISETVESRMLVERTKWAMRIHDGLTQSVTSAVLELQSLRHRIETDPAEALASLETVERAIREDLREVRGVLFELHEGEPRPDQPLARFVDQLVSRWRLHARVAIEGELEPVPARVAEAAHAVIAEALANAARHSGSPDVAVRVRSSDQAIRIEVEDRGRGIAEPDEDDEDLHFGLRLMRARAEDIGGSIEIGQTPGGGTRVVALLPVGEQEER
jgi:two-component system, NarL family, nitrate/nitrite sensor histidine kinase NarX